MKVRILFVGEMFLGRRPARLPRILTDRGLEPAELGPAAAWRNITSWALSQKVDAVVFTGGTVASPEDRFEALDDLEKGVTRLLEAGIPVCGVAGCRDTIVLPLLAERHEGFQLVGAGAEWSTCELELSDNRKVRLVGWSMPGPEFEGNPLESLPTLPDDQLATIGVLPCPLDGDPNEDGVVIPARALAGTSAHAWMVGGRSAPDELASPRPVGHVGGAIGFGPQDAGLRGPWLLTVHGPGQIEADHIASSPIRWESAEISLNDMDRIGDDKLEEEMKNRVLGALRQIRKRSANTLGEALAAPCRIRFTGTMTKHLRLRAFTEGTELLQLHEESNGVAYYVHDIVDECRAEMDLEQIARDGSIAGLLANRLLRLAQGGAETDELLQAATEAIQPVIDSPIWADLETEGEPLDIRACLTEAGTLALEELLVQKAAEEAQA